MSSSNNGDPKRPIGVSKATEEHAQSATSESLAESMWRQREQRKMKASGKAVEVAE